MKQRSGRGCMFYGIGFFIGIPLLLVGIAFLVISGRERSAKRKLNERIKKIVAQGLPVDDATLLNFTDGLTSKEDTKEWLEVLGELTSEHFTKSTAGLSIFHPVSMEEVNLPTPGKTWTDERVTREFLANWSELRSRISRLSRKQLEPGAKPVRFLTEFHSTMTLLPQTQNMRLAAKMLMLSGQVAIFDRNSAQTRLSIESLLGCSRTIAGEPILVSQMVHVAIEGMGISILRSALEHNVLSEQDLIVLLPRILDEINISPRWKTTMQGERAMMLPVFEHPELVVRSEGIGWLPGRSTDTLHYLDFMDQLLDVPIDDLDRFRAGLNGVEQDLKSLDGPMLLGFDSLITNLMTPAMAAAGNAYVRDAVLRRMAVLCIGIRLYEKRNGKMPANLDDLKSLDLGEPGINPSALLPPGGQPFGYKIQEDQVLLWGFDVNLATATPPEPPETPNAAPNTLWIWTLKTTKE